MTNPSSSNVSPLVTRATELTHRLYTSDDSPADSVSLLYNEALRNEWRQLGKKVWRFAVALKQLDKRLETEDFSAKAKERLDKLLQTAGNAFADIERSLDDPSGFGGWESRSPGVQQRWVQYWQSVVLVLELTTSCLRRNEDTRCSETLR